MVSVMLQHVLCYMEYASSEYIRGEITQRHIVHTTYEQTND